MTKPKLRRLAQVNPDAVRSFMRNAGLSESTVDTYLGIILRFRRDRLNADIRNLSDGIVRRWVLDTFPGRSRQMVARGALLQLWEFMRSKGMTKIGDPLGGWRPPGSKKRQRAMGKLTADEVLTIRMCSALTPRQLALVWVLSETGARASAVARMLIADVIEHPDGTATARIAQDKARQKIVRPYPLSRTCMMAVKAHLETERRHPRWLWPDWRARDGRPPTRERVEGPIRTAIRRVFGSSSPRLKGMNVHAFRHALADEMRRRGADLDTIREALGQASVLTTERYFETTEQSRIAAMKSCLVESYARGAPSIHIQLDPSPEELRWRLRMYGRCAVSGTEIGPVRIVDVEDKDVIFSAFGDAVAWAKEKTSLPAEPYRWEKWPAKWATKLEAFDRARGEVIWTWKREV